MTAAAAPAVPELPGLMALTSVKAGNRCYDFQGRKLARVYRRQLRTRFCLFYISAELPKQRHAAKTGLSN